MTPSYLEYADKASLRLNLYKTLLASGFCDLYRSFPEIGLRCRLTDSILSNPLEHDFFSGFRRNTQCWSFGQRVLAMDQSMFTAFLSDEAGLHQQVKWRNCLYFF